MMHYGLSAYFCGHNGLVVACCASEMLLKLVLLRLPLPGIPTRSATSDRGLDDVDHAQNY